MCLLCAGGEGGQRKSFPESHMPACLGKILSNPGHPSASGDGVGLFFKAPRATFSCSGSWRWVQPPRGRKRPECTLGVGVAPCVHMPV